ncbi:hypothetical protein N431DRAFT_409002 [Stipitochalara longipes BDJ]|nr:hypothetical protein N431DRAFT_409002 [Stipitochalara longipes BDJ]
MEAPAKNRRAGKPKVRTGCLVCKTRKVKCDESKPECNRCKKLEIGCRYTPPQTLTLVPKSTVSFVPIRPRQAIGQNPSSSIPGDESEHRYFQLFQEKLSYDLCGYFETPFWTHLIPQECHHEPAVRHAIFALSALYKSSASRTGTIRANDEHMDFALVQHSKAIGCFRKSLSKEQPQVRLALLASLLFGCFESFHGNWETASQQIHSGLNILGQWERSKLKGKPTRSIIAIDSELGVALTRLQLQLESYLAMNPMNEYPLGELENPKVGEYPPARFANLAEAFPFALSFATCAIQHSRKATRYLSIEAHQKDLERERDTICDYALQWKKAFRPLILETESGYHFQRRDYCGILQLHICVMGFEIMLHTSLSREESVFDHYTEQFSRMVVLCRRLFELDNESRKSDYLKAQFGLGLIMTIYYVATRCRDSVIRRDAIFILRQWPTKNGIWDSLQAAQVAEWIMGIEEEAACGKENIPEEARVRMNSLKVTRHKGGFDVECIQGHTDGVWRPRKATLDCW